MNGLEDLSAGDGKRSRLGIRLVRNYDLKQSNHPAKRFLILIL